MRIVRFISPATGQTLIGVDDGEAITEFGGIATVGELLRLTAAEIQDHCATADGPRHETAKVQLLPPADGRMDVWAAGVTYERSRTARMVESERAADVYDLVYEAPRPELFFKSTAWRVTGHGESVSVRADSGIDVPEPELGLIINRHAEIVGYTVVNDMSSRTIEGENPLYLPQAKIYLGGCAVGPAIRPAWEIPDPYALDIALTITRDGSVAWDGQASTGQLRRRLDELVGYLFREDAFPEGAILATGTCLVPDLPFTLRAGDEITISISGIGTLTSTVVAGKAAMNWLAETADEHGRRAPLRG
ncbi:fumarylacetoacetate (FAA) hydrolase [Acrocarpospora phusangensis]|uniref:Fumarylacetoacetate (FAA) hydrolase n=1 Tax=Acrocarpospora phusangensis TaxID=1070424 RepID=A0A919USL3_9ACTN|nr:fumarylacetoacetate hydrolase family protein [Acrocarpospora phusangensis]GIH26555.1 fumarylacetoacetate (FAA) hydrolase [Acrocarpospora phusangensis]